MKPTINPKVKWVEKEQRHIELLDTRTDFHISIDHEELLLQPDGQPTDEVLAALEPLGLLADLPIAELRSIQRPVRKQMQASIRNEKLQALLEFTGAHVPYYRENSAYDGENILDTDDLSKLPILTKADLRSNFNEIMADDINVAENIDQGTLSIVRTSGTTDERIQVLSDMRLDRVPPDFARVWNIAFKGETPRTAILTTPICMATQCNIGDLPLNDRVQFGSVLYLNSTDDFFFADQALIRNIADDLRAFEPEILLGNPIHLHWFAREAMRFGIELPRVAVVLTSYQFAPIIQKRKIEKLLGAPVYEIYTATELAGCGLGVECHNGHWHVREDHTVLEIVEPSGQVSDDGIGSVTVTTVGGRIAPLIRYDVGDLARLIDVDCDCPLSDWQCFEFHGRRKDALHLGGTMVTTRAFDQVISALPGIDFYQCRQTGDGGMTIDIVPSDQAPADMGAIADHIRTAFDVSNVVVQRVARLQPETSMKYQITGRQTN